MLRPLRGETVVVSYREQTGVDAFHSPVYKDVEMDVDNVLVEPGEAADVIESVRPDGTEVNYTLRFPKTFKEASKLENGKVKVRGQVIKIIGHPDYLDPEMCPTDWNMTVKVGKTNG